MNRARLACSEPGCRRPSEGLVEACPFCGGLLEVVNEFDADAAGGWPARWAGRRGAPSPPDRSGVWRFRELLPFLEGEPIPVTLGEGNTPLVSAPRAASWAGVAEIQVKHQGMNPTGSFKDLGMTACVTHAVASGAKGLVCASTGNTSASMAAYAARAGLPALLFLPRGSVAKAKLAQALDFGVRVLEVGDNFDQAFALMRKTAPRLGWYVVNSVNPYRLEGQKTLAVELLEQLGWTPPDFLVVPGGNLGNVSALHKGLAELEQLGLLGRRPRLVVVQASGAAPFFEMLASGRAELQPEQKPQTAASAIRIGNPANWRKALRAVRWSEGLCTAVSDEEIDEAKRVLAADGLGCEPASAATLAGVARLRREGVLPEDAHAVLVLTGHQLKDADFILERHQEPWPAVAATEAAVQAAMGRAGPSPSLPPPVSRAVAIEQIESLQRALEERLARLDDLDWERPATVGGGDWSVRDLVGHIASWEEIALEGISATLEGRPPQASAQTVDALNAEMVASKRQLSLHDLRETAAQVHRRLLERIETLDPATWAAPAGPQPGAKRLADLVGGALASQRAPFRHLEDHLPDLPGPGRAGEPSGPGTAD